MGYLLLRHATSRLEICRILSRVLVSDLFVELCISVEINISLPAATSPGLSVIPDFSVRANLKSIGMPEVLRAEVKFSSNQRATGVSRKHQRRLDNLFMRLTTRPHSTYIRQHSSPLKYIAVVP